MWHEWILTRKSLCWSTKQKIDHPTTGGMQGPRLLPQAGQSKGRDKPYGPNIHGTGYPGGCDKPCNAYRYWSVTIIDKPSSQKDDLDTSKYKDWIEWTNINIDCSQESPHNKSGSTKPYRVHTHKSSTKQYYLLQTIKVALIKLYRLFLATDLRDEPRITD